MFSDISDNVEDILRTKKVTSNQHLNCVTKSVRYIHLFYNNICLKIMILINRFVGFTTCWCKR